MQRRKFYYRGVFRIFLFNAFLQQWFIYFFFWFSSFFIMMCPHKWKKIDSIYMRSKFDSIEWKKSHTCYCYRFFVLFYFICYKWVKCLTEWINSIHRDKSEFILKQFDKIEYYDIICVLNMDVWSSLNETKKWQCYILQYFHHGHCL